MQININPDWILRMAKKESNKIVSVGGLVVEIARDAAAQAAEDKIANWSQVFPIKEMRKLNFSVPKLLSDSASLLSFFGVSSTDEWNSKWSGFAVAYRQTQKFDFHRFALAAWVREAEIVARQIPLKDFDETKLQECLGDLRKVTRENAQAGLDRAQSICAEAGVALVLVPELPGTRISGCARWLSDKHAMIGLTIRYKWADQLWFTLFHEIGHVLLHRALKNFVIDNAADHMGDSVVDPDMLHYEEEADKFASDTLIPPDELARFLKTHRGNVTNDKVHNFAEALGIGPGIVIGRLHHDGILDHWQGTKLRQKLEWHFVSEE